MPSPRTASLPRGPKATAAYRQATRLRATQIAVTRAIAASAPPSTAAATPSSITTPTMIDQSAATTRASRAATARPPLGRGSVIEISSEALELTRQWSAAGAAAVSAASSRLWTIGPRRSDAVSDGFQGDET